MHVKYHLNSSAMWVVTNGIFISICITENNGIQTYLSKSWQVFHFSQDLESKPEGNALHNVSWKNKYPSSVLFPEQMYEYMERLKYLYPVS